jgi:hypothetical protein
MGEFVDTVIKYPAPPKDGRGGPGEYDGAGNGSGDLQKRTPSPNACPEKLYDKVQGE